jgi:hypothetical protein
MQFLYAPKILTVLDSLSWQDMVRMDCYSADLMKVEHYVSHRRAQQKELLTERMRRVYPCAVEVEDKTDHLERLVDNNSTHFRTMNVREAGSPSLPSGNAFLTDRWHATR